MATETTTTKPVISFGSCFTQVIGSDWLKAGVTTFFTALFSTALILIMPLLTKQDLPTWLEIRFVLMSSLASGLGAISRKYFTNSVGEVFKKDPPNVDNSAAKA